LSDFRHKEEKMSNAMPLSTTRRTKLKVVAPEAAETTVPLPDQGSKFPNDIAKAVMLLMPGPDTPGFDLCSPRSFQVWIALVQNAARHGEWASPNHLPAGDRYEELQSIRPNGLTAYWTVEQLAQACGVDARTVHRQMSELRDLGWLRWSRLRDDDGQYTGITYVLQIPPSKLTDTAAHHYREELKKKQDKLAEAEARINKWQPELTTETRAML
jgi:hypothetical protein